MWRGRWGGGGRRNAASSPDLPSPSPAAWAEWCVGLEAWLQNQRLNAGGRSERGVSVCLLYNSCILEYIYVLTLSLCSNSFMSMKRTCFAFVFDVFICSCLLLFKAFSACSTCWAYFKKTDQFKCFLFFRQAEWPGPILHPSPPVARGRFPLSWKLFSVVLFCLPALIPISAPPPLPRGHTPGSSSLCCFFKKFACVCILSSTGLAPTPTRSLTPQFFGDASPQAERPFYVSWFSVLFNFRCVFSSSSHARHPPDSSRAPQFLQACFVSLSFP